MKLRILMIIKAVVCLLGVPILIAPEWVYGLFGASLNAGGVFAAREYGASMIGNLLLTWFARDAAESQARRAAIMGLCVYDAIGFVITLVAQVTGVLGPLGWLLVAIYLFFALGFGYFWLQKK